MDILLTHAYYLLEDPVERQIMKPYPPLGLLYIVAYLRSRGFAVDICDSTFMTRSEHVSAICEARAPIVGIYANLMTRQNVLQVINVARAAGSKVVIGGPEPANYSEEYLDHGADVIVVGEGELTLEELIPQLRDPGMTNRQAVPGIIYRDADGTTTTTMPRNQIEDLNNRPFPARESIDIKRYLDVWKEHHGASSISVITARGCPYTCRWCSHSVFGFSFRRRSPTDVADELEWIRDTYAPDRVWYADDVFAMSRHWLNSFADELRRRKLHFPFESISREDRLDEDVIKVLADMGCYRLWVGAESGSQRILDAMDRRTNAVRMRQVLGLLQQYGIRAGTFVMLGYDGETWDDITETKKHLTAALPDDVLTTLSYPIKGTPYYDEVQDRLAHLTEWDTGSDRDITVIGRRSRRFYGHAQKWIQSEVELSRASRHTLGNIKGFVKAFLRARKHRAAMYLTRHEVEDGRPAS